MKKNLGWLLGGLAVSCGLFNARAPSLNLSNPGQVVATGVAAGQQIGDASQKLEACEKFKKVDQTPLEVERGFGGAVMIAYGTKYGSPTVEMPRDWKNISPKKLRERVESNEVPQLDFIEKPNQLTLALNRLGLSLSDLSERPLSDDVNTSWTFSAVSNPSINAFSAPGGYVAVTDGLLKHLKGRNATKGQLMCVLAHEIGHVVKLHSMTQNGLVLAHQCQTGAVGSLLGSALSQYVSIQGNFAYVDFNKVGKEFVTKQANALIEKIDDAGYGFDSEYVADEVMVSLVAQAGQDPQQCIVMLSSLPDDKTKVFRNHPSSAERMEHVRKYLSAHKDEFPFDGPKLPSEPIPAEITNNI